MIITENNKSFLNFSSYFHKLIYSIFLFIYYHYDSICYPLRYPLGVSTSRGVFYLEDLYEQILPKHIPVYQ